MKWIAALTLAVLVLVGGASAGKPAAASAPLTLVGEQVNNNPSSPPWCLNEDDFHWREWQGSLSGSFSASEYFCTPGVDVYGGYSDWDAGNVGLKASVQITNGILEKLSIGNGTFEQDAVWTHTYIYGKGRNVYYVNTYMACVFMGSPNYPQGPYSGTWTMTLTGSYGQVTLDLTAENVAESYNCPAGQHG
jgi:hypothetical protein